MLQIRITVILLIVLGGTARNCGQLAVALSFSKEGSSVRSTSGSTSNDNVNGHDLRGGSAADSESSDSSNGNVEAEDSASVPASTSSSIPETPKDNEDEQISSDLAAPTRLRLEGKELHDKGDFKAAALLFRQAAESIQRPTENPDLSEEYATCRLHEALCCLKSDDFQHCMDACTDVLGDQPGAEPVSMNPAVRSRAYHRRAKAKLALGDSSGALQDARSAAFLGDRKAVTLYGKLMRESSPELPDLFPQSLSTESTNANSDLLKSIMGKSSSFGDSPVSGFNPASLVFGGNNNGNLLGSLLGAGAGGPSQSGLAKSMIQSMAKRLEDENMQNTICGVLQKTTKEQVKQLIGMAGMAEAINDNHVDRLLNFCHGVTPKTIRRTVKTTKGAVYGVKLLKKMARIANKYKSLLVALFILQWTKSAYLRPLPINRAAAKQATKKQLKDALKANRP